jgi:two-component system chemotaxis response regulator CheB
MSGHDIVVIGSSAGKIKALGSIVFNLPSDIDAGIFIGLHLAPNSPSFFPSRAAIVPSAALILLVSLKPDALRRYPGFRQR